MSSTILRPAVIPSTGVLTDIGQGNFFMLVQAAAPVNVVFARGGTQFGAENVQGGYVKGEVEGWDRCRIEGTPGTVIRYFVGFENITEDFTDYRRTVGEFEAQLPTVYGVKAQVNTGDEWVQVLPARPGRYCVTVKCHASSTSNVRVAGPNASASGEGLELRPGEQEIFWGSGAIWAWRVSAGAVQGILMFNEQIK